MIGKSEILVEEITNHSIFNVAHWSCPDRITAWISSGCAVKVHCGNSKIGGSIMFFCNLAFILFCFNGCEIVLAISCIPPRVTFSEAGSYIHSLINELIKSLLAMGWESTIKQLCACELKEQVQNVGNIYLVTLYCYPTCNSWQYTIKKEPHPK